jgi:hypothetical protein
MAGDFGVGKKRMNQQPTAPGAPAAKKAMPTNNKSRPLTGTNNISGAKKKKPKGNVQVRPVNQQQAVAQRPQQPVAQPPGGITGLMGMAAQQQQQFPVANVPGLQPGQGITGLMNAIPGLGQPPAPAPVVPTQGVPVDNGRQVISGLQVQPQLGAAPPGMAQAAGGGVEQATDIQVMNDAGRIQPVGQPPVAPLGAPPALPMDADGFVPPAGAGGTLSDVNVQRKLGSIAARNPAAAARLQQMLQKDPDALKKLAAMRAKRGNPFANMLSRRKFSVG